ncbi:MAG: PAS domain-containing protein [Alphaproteobacteria bacterium]|nr:PAS domain-containing protein [Alphaproteobacteria bacterium]
MSLSTITGRQAEILHPTTRSLYQAWDAIRRGRSAPSRDELDLRAIKDLLANVAVVERHPLQPTFSFRLAGTALRKIFGKELTGTSFLALWSPVEQTTIAELASIVISKHQPATVRFKGFAEDGRVEGIELIMLPMVHTDRRQTQIIAAIAPLTGPYWLGMHAIVRNEMISHRLIRTDPYSGVDSRPQDVFADKGRPLTAPVMAESKPLPGKAPQHYPSSSAHADATVATPRIEFPPRKLQLIRGGID